MVSLLKAWKVTVGPTVVGVEVQPCRLSTSLQEGPHQKLIFLQNFLQVKYYSRYCQLSCVITGKLLATHLLFSFPFTKIWN